MMEENLYVIKTRKEALTVLDLFILTRDDAVLTEHVRHMSTHDDECAFSIIQGSASELTTLTKMLSILRRDGLIDDNDALSYIRRNRSSVEAAEQEKND